MEDKERYEALMLLLNTKFDNVEVKLVNIHEKMGGVNEHLKKINGKVAEHEKIINEAIIERAQNREWQKSIANNHIINCPIKDRVVTLENDKRVNISLKHFIISTIGIVATFITIAVGVAKLTEINNVKASETQIKQIEEIIKPLQDEIKILDEKVNKKS